MWFHGENESFIAEFIWNMILLKGMSASLNNFKLMSFLGLPF
jgi:hypothetical protein